MKKLIILSCFLFSGVTQMVYSQDEDPINAAILNILINENVNQFIEDSIIAGRRETLTISDMENFIDQELIELLKEYNIDFLYFPFIELNNSNRDTIQIINLDDVQSDSQLVNRITNNTVTLGEVMTRLTVMYKTEWHNFDENATLQVPRYNEELFPDPEIITITLEGRWLPWRRCYCTRGNLYLQPDGTWDVSSQGSCLMYHQEEDRCGTKCGRTGFFDQECSGNGCPSC